MFLGSYFESRAGLLRRTQNPDGGWGYFPGKKSWLEPTVYAALALRGETASDRAWRLLSSWQRADGSWPAAEGIRIASSGTAQCVTLAMIRGESGEPVQKGVAWLLGAKGSESRLRNRMIARLGLINVGRNLNLQGWAWKAGDASWVEPTVHALIALKKVRKGTGLGRRKTARLLDRVRLGEALLFDVRCRDGGWNYGSRSSLGVDLPSYPETTAWGLLGLQGHPEMGPALDLGLRLLGETPSPLARALLKIALRVNGVDPGDASGSEESAAFDGDLLIAALELLGAPEGNYGLLRTDA